MKNKAEDILANDLEDAGRVVALFDIEAVVYMWRFKTSPRMAAKQFIEDNGWCEGLDIEDLGIAYKDVDNSEIYYWLNEGSNIFAEEEPIFHGGEINASIRFLEDIAKKCDYASWKSLEVFIRWRLYIWNGDESIYEPETTNTYNIRDQLISNISIKAEQVMNRISEGEDPRQIAKSLGFEEGNRQMADYMEKEGLIWDMHISNRKIYLSVI